MSSLGKKG